MSSPQIQNGYTKLANELLDALIQFRIPGEARQCLDFIIRKTYGFHKKKDNIPLSQFVSATGLSKQAVCRAINKLIHLGMIIKKDNARGTEYEFNKDFSSWHRLSKKITARGFPQGYSPPLSKKITSVIKNDNPESEKIRGF